MVCIQPLGALLYRETSFRCMPSFSMPASELGHYMSACEVVLISVVTLTAGVYDLLQRATCNCCVAAGRPALSDSCSWHGAWSMLQCS